MFSKNLMTACSIPIILSILKQKDSYGYELIRTVKELSEDVFTWKEGSLYPVLKKLEQKELIRSFWKLGLNGKRRKYYAITVKGRLEAQRLLEEWAKANDFIHKIQDTQNGLY